MDAQIVTTPDTRKGLTMSAASWPRDRREAACAAAHHPATATSTALIDGVAWRIERLDNTQDPEIISGLRYCASLLLTELVKRHGLEVRLT
jgi:hypothetical protein